MSAAVEDFDELNEQDEDVFEEEDVIDTEDLEEVEELPAENMFFQKVRMWRKSLLIG